MESDWNCDWKTFSQASGKLASLLEAGFHALELKFCLEVFACTFSVSKWGPNTDGLCFILFTHSDIYLAPTMFWGSSGGRKPVVPTVLNR